MPRAAGCHWMSHFAACDCQPRAALRWIASAFASRKPILADS